MLAALAAAAAIAPLPAPSVFVTSNYGLTFRTPPHAFHCPLSKDWVGSDHGTVVFLERPTACFGAGYPSSSRGYAPEDLPRVDVFYAYWSEDLTAPPCSRAGQVRLMGRLRPVCRERIGKLVRLSSTARYKADIAAEATVSLVTTPARLDYDLAAFRIVAASMAACRADWKDDRGRPFTIGTGPPCPPNGRWF